jgi:hypothetical protein
MQSKLRNKIKHLLFGLGLSAPVPEHFYIRIEDQNRQRICQHHCVPMKINITIIKHGFCVYQNLVGLIL